MSKQSKNVLIVSTCSDPLSDLEFVHPVASLVGENGYHLSIFHHAKLDEDVIYRADKIIITGTALKDFEYLKNIDLFGWIKRVNIPILGICAGCQILGKIMGEDLGEKMLIGKKLVSCSSAVCRDLVQRVEFEAYFLSSRYVKVTTHFNILAVTEGIPSIIRHSNRPFLGCLFHPEVLNPQIILNFLEHY